MDTNDNLDLAEILARSEKIEAQVSELKALVTELLPLASEMQKRRENDRKRQAECRNRRKACHVTKKCHVTKEKEKAIENIPPTPPIRDYQKEKESIATLPRARVREGHVCVALTYALDFPLSQKHNVHKPPCLAQLLSFATHCAKITDSDFVFYFWQRVAIECYWTHWKTGDPIRNWCASFRAWYNFREVHERLIDPDRIPDARKGGWFLSEKEQR